MISNHEDKNYIYKLLSVFQRIFTLLISFDPFNKQQVEDTQIVYFLLQIIKLSSEKGSVYYLIDN